MGAGPRGIGVLERIAANAPELVDGPLTVHLIDPHPPGPGRVWRFDQSALLRMNSMPEDVTAFTDESVTCDGPIRPGPTLAEWADRVRSGEVAVDLDPAVRAEIAALTSTTFPTRRLQSAYLDWVYAWVLETAPPNLRVVEHHAAAVDVTGPPDGPQRVWLAGRDEPVEVDFVVLCLGHLDVRPSGAEARTAAHAAARGLRYVPPGYTADLDLSGVPAGEDVIVRGFGLAFVDLVVLLTEGRGGRFRDGRYHPSGREPVLHVGSRRGVPYHAKPEYRLVGSPPPVPRFFGPADVAALTGPLDFRRDVWPLAAKEIGWGYYHELFTGHPDRVRVDWTEFAGRYAELDWESAAMRALVDSAVAEGDRIDLAAIDRPLAGLRFPDRDALTRHTTAYIEADLTRRADRAHSADLGAFLTLLSVYGSIARLVQADRFTPESLVDDVDGWWHGFFSFYASGPPGHRLRELLALVRAGLVRFVGPDMRVRAEADRFTARSPAVPGEVSARTLIDARLPDPSVDHAADPLLRALRDRGEVAEDIRPPRSTGRIRTTPTSLLADAGGVAHPRRYALGPHTSTRSPGAFARPRTNAPGFRQNDAVARAVLAAIDLACAATTP